MTTKSTETARRATKGTETMPDGMRELTGGELIEISGGVGRYTPKSKGSKIMLGSKGRNLTSL